MKHEIAVDLLSAATYGTRTTTELVEATGRSPTTVIRYLGELERRGWMERLPAERIGAGRPPIFRRPTDAGIAFLRAAELARFRELSAQGARVLWGPTRSLAFWGVPFVGRPDVFADRAVDAAPFALVLERSAVLYEDVVEADEGRFPALEALVAWAAKGRDPRQIAAAAVLLGDPRLRADRLVNASRRMGSRNRVGFLGALAGRTLGIRPSAPSERMLGSPAPVEPETEALARHWRVENPISGGLVKDMEELYGGAP